MLPERLAWGERQRLRAVLREHPLVHLQAPRLRPPALLELARGLGSVPPEPRERFRLAGSPEIMVVGNLRDRAGELVAADATRQGFHSDRSFQKQPAELTLLYAVEVPECGGDTDFSSLYRVYDELDRATREAWGRLEVEHEASSRHFDAHPDRRNVHALIRRHPDSGRRLVYASPPYARAVLDLPHAHSRAILRRVADALEPPDYVHRWQPGDLLVWDNRALVHRATGYDGSEPRQLWRLSIQLDDPRVDAGA